MESRLNEIENQLSLLSSAEKEKTKEIVEKLFEIGDDIKFDIDPDEQSLIGICTVTTSFILDSYLEAENPIEQISEHNELLESCSDLIRLIRRQFQ